MPEKLKNGTRGKGTVIFTEKRRPQNRGVFSLEQALAPPQARRVVADLAQRDPQELELK